MDAEDLTSNSKTETDCSLLTTTISVEVPLPKKRSGKIPNVTGGYKSSNSYGDDKKLQLENMDLLSKLNVVHDQLAQTQKENIQLKQIRENNTVIKELAVRSKEIKEYEELKLNINKLIISDLQYVELSNRPSTTRSLLDEIRISIYEQVHMIKSDLSKVRRERDALGQIKEECDALKQQVKISSQEILNKNGIIQDQLNRIQILEHDLGIEKERFGVFQDRVQKLDHYEATIKSLEQDCAKSKEKLSTISFDMESKDALVNSLRAEKLDLVKQIDLLKLDKSYLEKEAVIMNSRILTLEEKLNKKTLDLECAKEGQLEQYNRILEDAEKQRAAYEERLREELMLIKRQSANDLEEIRRSTRDLYDRELSAARHNLESAKEEVRRRDSEFGKLMVSFTNLQQEHGKMRNELEQEVMLKSQMVKTKTFEVDRFKLIYEEALGKLKQSQLENEKLAAKIDVLTREFHALQNQMDLKIGEIQIENGLNKHKLKTLGIEPDSMFLEKFPASRNSAKENNDSLRREISRLKSEVSILQEIAGKKGDTKLLVAKIQEIHRILEDEKESSSNYREKYEQLEKEVQGLRRDNLELAADLKQFENNRTELRKIQRLVQDMITQRENHKIQK
ncbi:hypothetical protein MP638_003932 [Amoeboaphelidium occidentale]|nr:hypothetical protein MP638_003932 [Amoeboaphelidium occidentale]